MSAYLRGLAEQANFHHALAQMYYPEHYEGNGADAGHVLATLWASVGPHSWPTWSESNLQFDERQAWKYIRLAFPESAPKREVILLGYSEPVSTWWGGWPKTDWPFAWLTCFEVSAEPGDEWLNHAGYCYAPLHGEVQRNYVPSYLRSAADPEGGR